MCRESAVLYGTVNKKIQIFIFKSLLAVLLLVLLLLLPYTTNLLEKTKNKPKQN